MALESATYPSSLVTTNPVAGDPKSEGDDHIRMLKVCLKNATSGPAFSAYSSSAQTIPNGIPTKVVFDTEEYDTATCFDSATNYRFTPTVAGYYLVTWCVTFNVPVTEPQANLYRNGTNVKRGALCSSAYISNGSALVSMNGTTDYLEIFVTQNSGVSKDTILGIGQVYFQAHLARLA